METLKTSVSAPYGRDSGHLFILSQGDTSTVWQKRYSLVDQTFKTLILCASEEGSDDINEAEIKIELSNATLKTGVSHKDIPGFRIIVPDEDLVYTFRTTSWIETNTWVSSLKQLTGGRPIAQRIPPKDEYVYGSEVEWKDLPEVNNIVESNRDIASEPEECPIVAHDFDDIVPIPPDGPPPLNLHEIGNLSPSEAFKFVGKYTPRIRRAAGIVAIKESMSNIWRQVYAVIYQGLLVEYEHILDTTPKNVWKLTPDIRINPGSNSTDSYVRMLVYGFRGLSEITLKGRRTSNFDTTVEWGISLSELMEMDYGCVSVDGKLKKSAWFDSVPTVAKLASVASSYSLNPLLPLAKTAAANVPNTSVENDMFSQSMLTATALSYYAGGKGVKACVSGQENIVRIYSAFSLGTSQIPPWIQSEKEFQVQLWLRAPGLARDQLVTKGQVVRVNSLNGKARKDGKLLVYKASYVGHSGQDFRLHIKFKGHHIFGSPYSVSRYVDKSDRKS